MSTTAVSFRKGNHQENIEFAGVTGEIVADIGSGSHDDPNATIVLHTGDGYTDPDLGVSGVRMAREDLKNIKWDDAYRSELTGTRVEQGFLLNDLSNISRNVESGQVTDEVSEILQENFNLAASDGNNLSTKYIIDKNYYYGKHGSDGSDGKPVATVDLDNITTIGGNSGKSKIEEISYDYWKAVVDTDYLTSSYAQIGPTGLKTGGPLAYKDMSNVSTLSLAGTGPTATGKTAQGTALAYNDLSNVDYSYIIEKVNNAYDPQNSETILSDYEEKLNKQVDIWRDNIKIDLGGKGNTYYPTLHAVSSYVDLNIENCANRNLDNVTSWSVAARKEISYTYEVKHTKGDATAYNISQYGPIQTDIINTEMAGGYLIIQPQSIDNHGVMTATIVTPSKGYFSNPLSPSPQNTHYEGHGMDLYFDIISKETVPGNLMLSDFSNSEIKAYDNSNNLTYKGVVKYEIETADAGRITKVNSVNGQLYDTETIARFGAKYKSGTGAVSTIESYHYTGGDIENPVINKYSSIVVSNESAYLNKNIANENAETLDSNHELLNRSEIVTYVGNQIDSAIQQVISTAVVFKGIVANETLLPSSNQMNGDLYWITAFSSNPPSGMIEGRSGSAIWVQPSGSVGSWSYEMDSQNVPDGVTLKYTTTATSQVLSVKLSGAQNGVANAIQSTSDGSYVKTSTYLPALPQADGVYHLYVDNGTYTWINDARLVVTGS